jgi:hypothetical protein
MTILISRTDLARNTRKVIEKARKGEPIMVESYGEEQVAILDAFDYRLLRAYTHYQARDVDRGNMSVAPAGLTEEELEQRVADAGGDIQARWDLVVAAHQAHDISFGRAAELLHTNRFELGNRYNRLGIPLHLGPKTIEEVWLETEALRR